MNKNYENDCKTIYSHYGIYLQKQQLVQECAELIQAATKNDFENFCEELADVQVLIDQFLYCEPDIKAKVDSIKELKVNRQMRRIVDEQCKRA